MTTPPRPLDLVALAAGHLTEKGVENARLDAEILLAHVLDVRRLDLYLQFERPLEPGEVDAFRAAVRRRGAREPLQYITGEVAFRELTLGVDPRVLIPRPETEVLVGEVLGWLAGEARGEGEGEGDVALDLGTGTGAIALSLLWEGAMGRVVATDASAGALEVAVSNAERHGLADRLDARHGSVWEPIGPEERFRVIVANPPYVAEGDAAALAPEVVDHEPRAALFAGADGLDVIREIVAGAGGHLRAGGLLALEVGFGQAAEVVELLRGAGFGGPWVARDLSGRERIVLAERES